MFRGRVVLRMAGLLISGVILFVAGLIYVTRYPRPVTGAPPGPEEAEAEFEQTWQTLDDQWLATLESPGWVYFTHRSDLAGDVGFEREAGWPLPNRSLDEVWYHIDNRGQITQRLTRRIDLDRGNVWLGSWENGLLVFHYPGNKVEMTDDGPPSLRWALGSPCTNFGKSGRTVTLKLLDEKPPVYEALIKIDNEEPEYSAGDIEGYYWGQEIVCRRDAETGAPLSVEQTLIDQNRERVFLSRFYDFHAERVPAPPADMLALFEER